MATFEEYTNQQLKKKKKKKNVSAKNTSFTEYTKAVLGIDDIEEPIGTPKKQNDDDIAPVKKSEERTWFKKSSLFDDGWQFGDVSRTFASSAEDFSNNVMAGLLGIGEGVVDTGAYVVGGIGKLLGQDDFADKVSDFAAKDLYDEEELVKKLNLSTNPLYAATTKKILGIDTEEHSVFGEKIDSVAQSGGQLLGQLALQSVGVPWFVTSGVTSFGSEVESAFNEGATYGEAGVSGLFTAGAEILTEKLSGGIKFGKMGTLDDGLTKALARGISNKFVRSAAKLGMDVLGEGAEEWLSEDISRFGQWLTYQDENSLAEMLWSEEAMDAKIEAFLGGAMLGGVGSGTQGINALSQGRDATSGLTANEEAVFKKIFDERVAEEEKGGKKLSLGDKTKIHNEILEDLEKGRIDTDTIESVLGGDAYNSYKDTVDSEEAILKEFAELGNKQNPTLAEQSRYAELKAQIDEIKSNSKRNELKTQLSDEVQKQLIRDVNGKQQTDDYLIESYNERARRGQVFEADVSQYDEKQRATIQSAIDSGILNNTRRTHEMVDMVAKISADKGVLFDFSNSEKIAQTSYAVEGKTVNAFVTKDGNITLNIDSRKYLDSVVGHEITHVLEGSELYGELQKTLFEYAKSKGEYEIRRKELESLYNGVKDADVDAELTADLVGDYLFRDSEFIDHLTSNRNVFQQIYDEIKYLCKVATAGSKEARELEKVKRAFEKAYKEGGKAQSDKQYSLSEEQQDFFKDSKVRDENGNLKVMYHGTSKGGYTVFDTYGSNYGLFGQGSYFTDSKNIAESYTKKGKGNNPQVYETYLNITNPMDMDGEANPEEWRKAFPDADFPESGTNEDFYRAMEEYFMDEQYPKWEAAEAAMDSIMGMGYDGITHIGGGRVNADGTRHRVYIAFNPEQIKNIDNVKPTENPDIRYSISADSDGKNITNESTGYAYGESYFTMSYKQDGKVVGTLKYGEFDGQPNVKMIEVSPDYRRQGIGKKLLQELQKKYPDTEIDFGMTTPDGTKLLDAITYNVTDEAIAADMQKLKDLQTELNELQEKLDILYDTENLTEAQETELEKLGDRWEEVYHDIHDLENSLRGKKSTKTFVKMDSDARYSLSQDSEGRELSQAVKNRFGNSKVVDENGSLKVVYHGTATGEFTIFDKSKGSVEGDFGSGFYFTDNEADVSEHYEGGGPDFENKVARRAEQIEMDEEIDYDEAEQRAREELYKGSHKFEVYLNIEKPAVVGETLLFDSESYYEEYNREDYDSDEDYEGDVEQLLMDDIDNILWDIDKKIDVYNSEGVANVLYEAFYNGGIGIEELKKQINDLYLENSNGELVGNEVTRQIIESLGYDGIIDPTVSGKWNMEIEEGTTHYIVFKPNQIKAVTNQNPTDNPDINLSLSKEGEAPTKRYGKYAVRGKDIALEKTPLEDIAPTQEQVAPTDTTDDLSKLELEHKITKQQYLDANRKNDTESVRRLSAKLTELEQKIAQAETQRALASENIAPVQEGVVEKAIDTRSWRDIITESFLNEKSLGDETEWTDAETEAEREIRTIVANKSVDEVIHDVESGMSAKELMAKSKSALKEYESIQAKASGRSYTEAESLMLATLHNQYSMYDSVARNPSYVNELKGATENTTTTDLPIDDTDYSPVVDEKAELEAEIENIGEEIATIEKEIEQLTQQAVQKYSTMLDDNTMKEYEAQVKPLDARHKELRAKRDRLIDKVIELEKSESAMQRERVDSIDDADAPPEMEAPYNAPREAITIDSKALTEITKEVADIIDLDAEDSQRMAETIQRFAQNENLTESELFEDIKRNFLYHEEAVTENGEDVLSQAKKHMRKTKLYIPENYKGDFHGKRKDGFNAFRKEHIGHFYLTTDETTNAMSVDQLYNELNGLYPNLFPDNIGNIADQLKRMGEVADMVQETETRVSPYDDETIQEVCDKIINGLARFSEGEAQRFTEEARNSFLESVGADIAPVAEAPDKAYEAIRPKKSQEPRMKRVKEGEDIAPTYETTANGGQRQRTMFADGKTAKIVDAEPTSVKEKGGWWSWFMRNFVDKLHIFEKLSLKTGNKELQSKANFMRSSESRAQHMIGKGIKGKDGSKGARALTDIRKEVESKGLENDFENYLYHMHNIDRMTLDVRFGTENKAVFGDTVTAEVSRNEVKQYEAKHPEFKRLAQDVYDYNTYLRKMLVDSGVISQETADLWEQMYPHYVPIRRQGDFGASVNVPLDTRKTGVNAPVKRAVGGNGDMIRLFKTMAARTEQTFRAIAKNNFGVELKNTLGTQIANQGANVDEIIDSFDKHEELLKEGKNGMSPTFTVFENGERVTFEITDDMYRAMKPKSDEITAFENTKLAKGLNIANNIRRGLITEYNPVFLATNAIKDTQDILINSQHAAKTYAKIPEAIKELTTKGKWYTEYMENGGEQNTYFDGQSNTFKAEDTGFKKIIGIPLRAISAANNFVERAPRLAEYIASREAGASIESAMLDAARVTTNFAAGGDITKVANKHGVTFLNASVQGAAQQVRNIREAKWNGFKGWAQLATKFAIAGLPAMILNSLLWDDDEEYEELSDYVKDNYYIVAKYGDGQFVRIPKGRTVAVIQDAFEQISNALTGDDEADWRNLGELVVSNLAPNNPLDNNIVAPIKQAITNKTWYGEELVPTRLQDLPASEQFDESTDAISKWLGEATNTSPIKWNYLLDQYSGGLGDVFLPMMTPEAERGDDSLLGNIIAPIKDKFTTDSVMNNQNVSDFYDMKDELTVNAKASTATDEDILMSKYINSVSSEIGKLYGLKREIQNSDLSNAKKYEKVRDIQDEINALARESLNTYENVYIDGDYAEIGDRHYRLNDEGEWTKISDKQYDKQEDVTDDLGISASDYWSNKSEYDFAYENPEKYAVAKSVGGYDFYKSYMSDLYDIKADKDESGKSIRGSRKEKVIEYVNSLDIDYGERLILYKGEYKADDTVNMEIIDYLNNREDITYEDMVSILRELGFEVDSKGNITWD